ncbi:hypothetical protein PIROE2DRAFT_15099 [Piromyces sp. E2]|nr:hypothetical protein PIROE2DRAFT_15099 [Piromyces sp. E2]|eukprot:OUM59378.1 hypothetical protein PIROE2DRAFT_15099 [Piromyces sp. E2]
MVNCSNTNTENSSLQSNILKIILFRKLCVLIDNYFKNLIITPSKITINIQYQCPVHIINIIIDYDSFEYSHIQCIVNFNDFRNLRSWKNINTLCDYNNISMADNGQNKSINLEQKQTENYNYLSVPNNLFDINTATISKNTVIFYEDCIHLQNISRIFLNNYIYQFKIKLVLKNCSIFNGQENSLITLHPIKCTRIWNKNLIRLTKILNNDKSFHYLKLCNYNIQYVNVNPYYNNQNNLNINSQTKNQINSQRNNGIPCNSKNYKNTKRNMRIDNEIKYNKRKRIA